MGFNFRDNVNNVFIFAFFISVQTKIIHITKSKNERESI